MLPFLQKEKKDKSTTIQHIVFRKIPKWDYKVYYNTDLEVRMGTLKAEV
jgi:hypothetical protein